MAKAADCFSRHSRSKTSSDTTSLSPKRSPTEDRSLNSMPARTSCDRTGPTTTCSSCSPAKRTFVNDRFVGARMEGRIGEMAALDPRRRAPRLSRQVNVVALKVPEPAFRACDASPRVQGSRAACSHRLRLRSAFVQPPNPQPVLFIGSSNEAPSIPNELQAGFKHDKFDAIIWKDGVFGPGGVALTPSSRRLPAARLLPPSSFRQTTQSSAARKRSWLLVTM